MSRSFTIGVVVMMKITSSTKARSSSGVMFNSASAWCWLLEHFFIGRCSIAEGRLPERRLLCLGPQRFPQFVNQRAVIDVLMLDGRGVFAGERVQLLCDGAHHRD